MRRRKIWTTYVCYCCSAEVRAPKPPSNWQESRHRGLAARWCPDCWGKPCSHSLAHTPACTCNVPESVKAGSS